MSSGKWKVKNPKLNEPRFNNHPDDGCEFFHECLECPFPKCYDDLSITERWAFRLGNRDALIITARRNGIKIKDLAQEYKLSPKSIYRIIAKRYKKEKGNES